MYGLDFLSKISTQRSSQSSLSKSGLALNAISSLMWQQRPPACPCVSLLSKQYPSILTELSVCESSNHVSVTAITAAFVFLESNLISVILWNKDLALTSIKCNPFLCKLPYMFSVPNVWLWIFCYRLMLLLTFSLSPQDANGRKLNVH